MIFAEQKPFEEIIKLLADAHKVLIVGCSICVTICFAGGEKAAATSLPPNSPSSHVKTPTN